MWYRDHHRRLPWRETRDPYRIWVSETMLQQTRVETVIPYYHAFLERFPDVAALAASDEEAVLKCWQGLGYYSRARNLHRAARLVVERHGGRIPDDPRAFLALPGVGAYTAGAVMSIAFHRPIPAVDGNVLRVVARLENLCDPVDHPTVRRRIERLVEGWLQQAEPAVFTQALMELGAVVCTPRSPRCGACPVRSACRAHRAGTAEDLPKRAPKRPRRQKVVLALWCETGEGVVVEQRPADGLLGGMWQLPAHELDADALDAPSDAGRDAESGGAAEAAGPVRRALMDCLQRVFPGTACHAVRFVEVARERHVFTHLEWSVRLFRPEGMPAGARVDRTRFRVVCRDELGGLPWPRVYEKLISGALQMLI
ncbi:MAG: A/G-specific adenine glycosylase [Alicyclobacillus sp.]|nr:A/G-specific adenine glycosylase [Alicyclobacillus sp.]